ncbi:hypothetical protein ID866_4888 [Astraeus odoratus]|nr:hypothetical protein ID866_4888 [Astraeus odoratus]
MRKVLGPSTVLAPSTFTVEPKELPQSLPPDVLEALQRPSRGKSTPRSLQDFAGGVLDISIPHGEGDGILVNKYDLICPRTGCGSVILKSGVGEWVERASVDIDAPDRPVHPDLIPLPAPPGTAHWWLITPSPMAFENIGFTRLVPSSEQSGEEPTMKLKLLICAECDLGPLGWTEEGNKEFWLACSRVKYA